MSILLLLVAGFLSDFGEGDPCIDALNQLRSDQRLEIVATDVLEENVVAFTLADSPRIKEKTALLVCQRDIDADDDADDQVDQDLDDTDEDLDPVDDTPDDPDAEDGLQ